MLKRPLRLILLLLGFYFLAFVLLPFFQSWWDSRKLKQGEMIMQQILKLSNSEESFNFQEFENLQKKLEKPKKLMFKINEKKQWLLNFDPTAREQLLSPHRKSDPPSYCFFENSEAITAQEIETWIGGFDPDGLLSEIERTLEQKPNYIGKFHQSNSWGVYSKFARFLLKKSPFHPNLHYSSSYFLGLSFLNSPASVPLDPKMLDFLERNSRFITHPTFLGQIVPKIRQKRTEVWVREIETGFRKLMGDVGDCYCSIGVSLKDLIQTSTCYDNSPNWKGPYVRPEIARELKSRSSSIQLGEVQKDDEGKDWVYRIGIDMLDPSMHHEMQIRVPKDFPVETKDWTSPECKNVFYKYVERKRISENRDLIQAREGRWEKIPSACWENLGIKEVENIRSLGSLGVGIQIPSKFLANVFWKELGIEKGDWIVSIDGSPLNYEGWDRLLNDENWPKRDSLVLEVVKMK